MSIEKQKGKVYILSHMSDIDGIGCIILGSLAFSNMAYSILANNEDLNSKFEKLIQQRENTKPDGTKTFSCEFDAYDEIYITDLCLSKELLDRINDKNSPVYGKVRIFDHHESAINEGCNEYSFSTIVPIDSEGKKRCGTDLFYEYLTSKGLITRTKALDDFVELTRLQDTWDWVNAGSKGELAHELEVLFNTIGQTNYRKRMLADLEEIAKKEAEEKAVLPFTLTDKDREAIEVKKKETDKRLQKFWSETEIFTDEENNTFAAVFANYEYRNEFATYIQKLIANGSIKEPIKYLVVVALDSGSSGQKSYRPIEEGFDVLKIAEVHGGNGHKSAASVKITPAQMKQSSELGKRDKLLFLVNSAYKKPVEGKTLEQKLDQTLETLGTPSDDIDKKFEPLIRSGFVSNFCISISQDDLETAKKSGLINPVACRDMKLKLVIGSKSLEGAQAYYAKFFGPNYSFNIDSWKQFRREYLSAPELTLLAVLGEEAVQERRCLIGSFKLEDAKFYFESFGLEFDEKYYNLCREFMSQSSEDESKKQAKITEQTKV